MTEAAKRGRGRPVTSPKPGEGKNVQVYLEPELAAKFCQYCESVKLGSSDVIAQALRNLFV